MLLVYEFALALRVRRTPCVRLFWFRYRLAFVIIKVTNLTCGTGSGLTNLPVERRQGARRPLKEIRDLRLRDEVGAVREDVGDDAPPAFIHAMRPQRRVV